MNVKTTADNLMTRVPVLRRRLLNNRVNADIEQQVGLFRDDDAAAWQRQLESNRKYEAWYERVHSNGGTCGSGQCDNADCLAEAWEAAGELYEAEYEAPKFSDPLTVLQAARVIYNRWISENDLAINDLEAEVTSLWDALEDQRQMDECSPAVLAFARDLVDRWGSMDLDERAKSVDCLCRRLDGMERDEQSYVSTSEHIQRLLPHQRVTPADLSSRGVTDEGMTL